MLFGGVAVWLTCFLATRVHAVGIRRLGVAEGTTAGAVAALAAGAFLIGPVRTLGLFIFAGSAAPRAGRPGVASEGAAAAPRRPAITRPLTETRGRCGDARRRGSPTTTYLRTVVLAIR